MSFSQETLDLCEQTRQGKNICECGTPKQMYFVPWCPRCEKPKIKSIPTINLIQALEHIATITDDKDIMDENSAWKIIKKGYKQRMWDLFIYYDDPRLQNDVIYWWGFFDDSGVEEELTPEERADVNLFRSTFDLEDVDHIYLDISW